jgi:hypothetical protein
VPFGGQRTHDRAADTAGTAGHEGYARRARHGEEVLR